MEIVVHNDGPAIPEQEQTRIFERFYRGTGARHIPGSGMGLAIVQQIARSHGGSGDRVERAWRGHRIPPSASRRRVAA